MRSQLWGEIKGKEEKSKHERKSFLNISSIDQGIQFVQ